MTHFDFWPTILVAIVVSGAIVFSLIVFSDKEIRFTKKDKKFVIVISSLLAVALAATAITVFYVWY